MRLFALIFCLDCSVVFMCVGVPYGIAAEVLPVQVFDSDTAYCIVGLHCVSGHITTQYSTIILY